MLDVSPVVVLGSGSSDTTKKATGRVVRAQRTRPKVRSNAQETTDVEVSRLAATSMRDG